MAKTISIDEFLTKSEDWVPVQPDKRYKQITAKLWGKGLTLRGEVQGSAIAAARQYKAKAGQFLISRIDARHGAFGIVPANLDGALVSNDFPCFDIDSSKVLPHFFEWYSRTPEFVDLCRRASEGSTNRVRMKEDKFLKMVVPLPSIDEQRHIVGQLDKVANLVSTAKQIRSRIDYDAMALVERLHLDFSEPGPRPLGDFIELFEDKILIEPDANYPQVGLRGFAGGLFLKDAISGTETSYKTFNRLDVDLLVVSQPKGWEGAVAVCEEIHAGWFASPEYRTFRCRDGLLDAEYLRRLIETPWFQHELTKLTRGQGARRERLRPEMLLGMTVQMPTIFEQKRANKIIRKLREIRTFKDPFDRNADALMHSLLHNSFNSLLEAA
ncbi:hypothetical protein [Sulfitobacter pacificus]|uniref:hypothetical protein n=1 Tax=Sulfitobacter pacificus TaxID=1499314 RepID=UPI00310ADEDD